MPSRDIGDMPPEFSTLAQALEEYCNEAGISEDSLERKALAVRVMELYANGYRTVDELKRALADS
jgi:hypothetical protein